MIPDKFGSANKKSATRKYWENNPKGSGKKWKKLAKRNWPEFRTYLLSQWKSGELEVPLEVHSDGAF